MSEWRVLVRFNGDDTEAANFSRKLTEWARAEGQEPDTVTIAEALFDRVTKVPGPMGSDAFRTAWWGSTAQRQNGKR